MFKEPVVYKEIKKETLDQTKEIVGDKKPRTEHREISVDNININIDYEWIARNSTFQTLWVEIIKHHFPNKFKGVNTRTTGKKMASQFNKKLKEVNKDLDAVEMMKKNKAPDYMKVMSEFKGLLTKQKVKVENGTN